MGSRAKLKNRGLGLGSVTGVGFWLVEYIIPPGNFTGAWVQTCGFGGAFGIGIGKENCGVVGSLLIGSLQFSMDNNMDAHLG